MTLKRINQLRKVLKAERISYGELHEIECACEEAGIHITEGMLAEEQLDALERLARHTQEQTQA